VRRAAVLCWVAAALALVFAVAVWLGNGLSGEAAVALSWRLAVLPLLFLLAGGLSCVAAGSMKNGAPRTGMWLAVLTACVGFAGALLQQSPPEVAVVAAAWLIVAVPTLIAARSARRASRQSPAEPAP
jgi:hypothetical protein